MSEIRIERTWDGDPLDESEIVTLVLGTDEAGWSLSIDAPFHGDAAPPAPAGRSERLWEFEVVELFLVGEGWRYLELEFGPHGHYLGLRLAGRRRVVDASLALGYGASILGDRWRGAARIPVECLPEKLRRWNAFSIHGAEPRRRYLAAHPLPGARPDFHQIDRFPGFDSLAEAASFTRRS